MDSIWSAVVLSIVEGLTEFLPVSSTGHLIIANDLNGVAEPIVADGTQYVLAKKNDKVGFYKATSGTIAAGKAYIQSPSNVKAFYFDFAGDATGIAEIENGKLKVESSIFNLAGQRVNKMQKGINIVNGKKVLF